MLLSRTRTQLLAGLAATAAGRDRAGRGADPGRGPQAGRQPCEPRGRLRGRTRRRRRRGWALARYPAVVPVALLAAAPFRISVSIGAQTAYLLVPLYVVLAAAMLAFACARPAWRRGQAPAAAARRSGGRLRRTRGNARCSGHAICGRAAIELLFFLFPFSALVVVVCRSPWRKWHPRALATTLIALAGALLRRRPLPTRDPRASARRGRRARKRVHDVLPRDVAVQGPERLRPSRRDRDRGAARRDLARPDRLLGRSRATRVSVGRSLLLVLAVELRRALRGRGRDLVRPRWADAAARAARGRRGLRARRRGVRRCHRGQRLRAPGDERPHAARTRDVGRLREPSARRRRHRRPAAGEQGRGKHAALRQARPLAHDAADRRSGARAYSASSSTPRCSPARAGSSTSSRAATARSGSPQARSSSRCSCTRCSTPASSRIRSSGV